MTSLQGAGPTDALELAARLEQGLDPASREQIVRMLRALAALAISLAKLAGKDNDMDKLIGIVGKVSSIASSGVEINAHQQQALDYIGGLLENVGGALRYAAAQAGPTDDTPGVLTIEEGLTGLGKMVGRGN